LRSSSKEVKRTVVVECYANKRARRIIKEIENAYKEMLKEMVEYALKHGASQSTLHEAFYKRFRERFPWLPTRVIKGAYRDAIRRAKSFRGLKKKGESVYRKARGEESDHNLLGLTGLEIRGRDNQAEDS
jgi:hypothetical protein